MLWNLINEQKFTYDFICREQNMNKKFERALLIFKLLLLSQNFFNAQLREKPPTESLKLILFPFWNIEIGISLCQHVSNRRFLCLLLPPIFLWLPLRLLIDYVIRFRNILWHIFYEVVSSHYTSWLKKDWRPSIFFVAFFLEIIENVCDNFVIWQHNLGYLFHILSRMLRKCLWHRLVHHNI